MLAGRNWGQLTMGMFTLGRGLRAMAVVALIAATAAPAAATHFRYRHYDWANKSRVIVPELAHTPDAVTGLGPQYLNVGGDVNGTPAEFGKLTFLHSGGIAVNGPSGLNYTLNGAVLFAGPASAPVFTAKKGDLFNPGSGLKAGTFAIAAVPEPDSWALMIAGFGVVGLAARRQRRLA
ncbi:hypothetical protein CHU93_13575 [Sandarakinorhabdus cyanobacteriorum]|uniref:Ice-binding protein C-terminal domain-containing protein n=1 Tax=Sandarakinorhabdus cyanobacteriorum TaxID=1981098 RepID=A0A255Y933_9SPHN|nr:PEPxxWA-CTERM sorting domain-containing protein [Sandarakinorhabdus cyanobacteriorum]OYQ25747.1 hypothetical protein CHU93_13575 [Sandarakinorhabdus cyanobacteriorum]